MRRDGSRAPTRASCAPSILVAVTALFAAVNISGVRKSIGLLGGLTVLKAVPLFIAAIAAIALTVPWPAPEPVPTVTEFEAGLLIVLYAFVGFEQAVVPAGETRNPAASCRAPFSSRSASPPCSISWSSWLSSARFRAAAPTQRRR